MQKEDNNIEQQALNNYQQNLEYLEKNHKSVYTKLTLLEAAINSGQYKEKYILEYKDDSYFDVLELSTNTWLYNQDSVEYSKNITDNITLEKTGSIFECQRFIDYKESELKSIKEKKLDMLNDLWATIDIVDYCKKNAPKTTTMIQSNKVIFLEIGLGLHLSLSLKKLNPKVIFISESNLELFRLSLFVTNYANLFKNKILFLSISESNEQEKVSFISFLDKFFHFNLYVKFIPFFNDHRKHLSKYQEYVISQEHLTYPYHAHLIRSIDSPRYLVEEYPFLNILEKRSLPILANYPILLVLSGPSAEKNILWIKENQNRFLVVCALATCKLLYMNDIQADIVINIHPSRDETLRFFKDIDKMYFKNTTVLLSSNVHPDVTDSFHCKNLYFIQTGSEYKKDFGSLGASSIGEYSYGLLLTLGAKEIYLAGLDLALDPDTLNSHNSYHPHGIKGTLEHNDSINIDEKVVFV